MKCLLVRAKPSHPHSLLPITVLMPTHAVRIMRLVTYVGYCEEVGHAAYASNETTAVVTQRGYIGGEKHLSVHSS